LTSARLIFIDLAAHEFNDPKSSIFASEKVGLFPLSLLPKQHSLFLAKQVGYNPEPTHPKSF
jgi:hypothetical protein